MDYAAEFKKYITGHQTSLAFRVTFSVVLPPVIGYYFHALGLGAAMSIGALCTSLTDTPGPPNHRRNGFYASIAFNCLTAVVVGFTNHLHYVLALEIVAFSFFFAFLSVFGTRAGSVGTLSILVLVLNIDSHRSQVQVVENALLIGAGGLWYAFLSLVLYTIFPYRMAQQAVGEALISTADYLRTRALFYFKERPLDEVYSELMKKQVVLQGHQDQVRELLYNTRQIVGESTPKSRMLLMMFLDSVDLLERIITTQQDYSVLHARFDGTGVLEQIGTLVRRMAGELEGIGIAVQAGDAYKGSAGGAAIAAPTSETPTAAAVPDLSQILGNVRDIQDRIRRLELYSRYDSQTNFHVSSGLDLNRFISPQPMSLQVFRDNLTMRSQVFRYALRLSLAMLTGYIISQFLPFGHGYWILLSIAVILKPLFGSTKMLYFQRLGGTLAGAALGGCVLYFVSGAPLLLILMILSMVVGYSLQKRNYFAFSVFITIYVLIAFHFLYHHDFREIVRDRVVDTVIGSAIALVAGFLVIPAWSHETAWENMKAMVRANRRYFSGIAGVFNGRKRSPGDHKLARKEVYVALANLSNNFQRILAEPKSQRKNVPFVHQFLVSNQMFMAHSASLAYYAETYPEEIGRPGGFDAITESILRNLDASLQLLDGSEPGAVAPPTMAGGAAGTLIGDQFVILHTISVDMEREVLKTIGTS